MSLDYTLLYLMSPSMALLTQQRNRRCKKEPHENYTTEKHRKQNENSLDKLSSRLEMTEERIR